MIDYVERAAEKTGKPVAELNTIWQRCLSDVRADRAKKDRPKKSADKDADVRTRIRPVGGSWEFIETARRFNEKLGIEFTDVGFDDQKGDDDSPPDTSPVKVALEMVRAGENPALAVRWLKDG